MPDRPWTKESQKFSTPIPFGAITPIPVMTTLLFSNGSIPPITRKEWVKSYPSHIIKTFIIQMFCPFAEGESHWGLTPPHGLRNGIKEVRIKANSTSTNSS
jgi:hypothetical protein